jgi:hypothetical protein
MSTSSTNNDNQFKNISSNNNNNNNNDSNINERTRKREDPTVSTLRYDWQMFISKMIHLSSSCKADSSSSNSNNIQLDIASKAKEVIDKRDELKKSLGKMENIVRGREEEIKGLVLDRGSAGVAGRKRRRRQSEQESAGDVVNFFLGE